MFDGDASIFRKKSMEKKDKDRYITVIVLDGTRLVGEFKEDEYDFVEPTCSQPRHCHPFGVFIAL